MFRLWNITTPASHSPVKRKDSHCFACIVPFSAFCFLFCVHAITAVYGSVRGIFDNDFSYQGFFDILWAVALCADARELWIHPRLLFCTQHVGVSALRLLPCPLSIATSQFKKANSFHMSFLLQSFLATQIIFIQLHFAPFIFYVPPFSLPTSLNIQSVSERIPSCRVFLFHSLSLLFAFMSPSSNVSVLRACRIIMLHLTYF